MEIKQKDQTHVQEQFIGMSCIERTNVTENLARIRNFSA